MDVWDWIGGTVALGGFSLMIWAIVMFVRYRRSTAQRRRALDKIRFPPSDKDQKAALRRVLESGADSDKELHELRLYAANFRDQPLWSLPLIGQAVAQLGLFIANPDVYRGVFVGVMALLSVVFLLMSRPSTRLGQAFLQRYPEPAAEV